MSNFKNLGTKSDKLNETNYFRVLLHQFNILFDQKSQEIESFLRYVISSISKPIQSISKSTIISS